jgi:hypothetical protein
MQIMVAEVRKSSTLINALRAAQSSDQYPLKLIGPIEKRFSNVCIVAHRVLQLQKPLESIIS